MSGLRTFKTPGGNTARMHCRDDTNDAMVCESIMEHDEYAIRELSNHLDDITSITDIGAHIGAWTVAMLLDFPGAFASAVEPLEENVQMLTANLSENGVKERCDVVPFAFSDKPGKVAIRWDWDDRIHRYIGNQTMPADANHQTDLVQSITPEELLIVADDVIKIDAEGAEQALIGYDLSGAGIICGEYHVPRGPLYEWLSRTHRVSMGNDPDFGYFWAVPRED